jgi:protein involved in polysaccharide export with SLBB domain
MDNIFSEISLYKFSEQQKTLSLPKPMYLGPGDKVAISIWGPTQENFALEIQKDGYIQPTGFATILSCWPHRMKLQNN